MTVGVAMAFALATGYGATAAISAPTHHGRGTGTITGRVQFVHRGDSGVVRISDASGVLIAHRRVRWDHSHFRFVLKPGRYALTLKFNNGVLTGCHFKETVRVRANHTTPVRWAEACGGGSY